MIRVTVELVSAIHPSRSRTLGVMEIANDGTGTESFGNYDARVLRAPDWSKTTRSGRVAKHDRRRLTVWYLIAKALASMGYMK